MFIRILADREPYLSYGDAVDGSEDLSLKVSPIDAGIGAADLAVVPVDTYLALPESLRLAPSFAYGPVSLIDAAFEAGCLDFLREPWSLVELLSRSSRIRKPSIRGEGFALDLEAGSLRVLAPLRANIELGEAERKLMRVLMLNAGKIVPREALCFALWGDEGRRSRAPDVHLSSIRRSLENACPGMGEIIKSQRGKGYRLLGKTCV